MSKVQMLLLLKKQRLTSAAAAVEIFALFEKTIAELEEQLSRSKEENERLQKLLDAVLQPQLRIHRADVQQLVVVKEELLHDQQEWSTSLDQEDPEPPPHIKQQQEDPRISQEGEQLQDQEEADITKSTFTRNPVESEDDKEKPQSSQPHQRQTEHMETEADGDDCRGPEPARNSDPESSLQPKTEGDTLARSAENKQFVCSVCTKSFTQKGGIKKHMIIHTGEKPYSCPVCEKAFSQSGNLKAHMRSHTGDKPFSCSFCKKAFSRNIHLKAHMRIHTEEKPHSCSLCKKAFSQIESLNEHMIIHTGEKPHSCSVCKKAFSRSGSLKTHMRVHTGEEIYSCNVCDKRFKLRSDFKRHKCVGRQSSQLNEIQTEVKREAEPPISSSAENMAIEADGEDNE